MEYHKYSSTDGLITTIEDVEDDQPGCEEEAIDKNYHFGSNYCIQMIIVIMINQALKAAIHI